MTDAIDAAVRLFERVHGGQPAGLWQSPGRVNLIGEHTDYNDGLVLPIALPQRTYAAVRPRPDRWLRLASDGQPAVTEIELDRIAPGRPDDWARYPAGVLWALARAGHPVTGLDVAIASDVPIGAGLSSSAALEGAVAAAVSDLSQLGLLADDEGRRQLAALCQLAENEIALAPTGGMDQAASLRAQAGHALNLDCSDGSVRQVPFDLTAAGLVLLVVDTGASHALGDGQYGSRRADCEQAATQLGLHSLRALDPGDLEHALGQLSHQRLRQRTRHVVTEIERVRQAVAALEKGDFVTLGRLFTASHASLRDDYEVSAPELDTVVETALAGGALGARMTGGGFGGSAIALVPTAALADLRPAIVQAFVSAGHTSQPAFIEAVAAGPGGAVPATAAQG
ncbi:MAG: galactokinase [Propionibacteriaceae bacterium]|jgi:galactokinase|nr:galactokinase [Propionibacteriaceae bacterium]